MADTYMYAYTETRVLQAFLPLWQVTWGAWLIFSTSPILKIPKPCHFMHLVLVFRRVLMAWCSSHVRDQGASDKLVGRFSMLSISFIYIMHVILNGKDHEKANKLTTYRYIVTRVGTEVLLDVKRHTLDNGLANWKRYAYCILINVR